MYSYNNGFIVSFWQNSPDRGRENDIDEDQNYSGYNSGDEHHGQKYDLTPEQWEERDKLFIKTMKDRGFVIEEIVEDGACLFRSISLQIYGDQDMHEIIRNQTMDYIVSIGKFGALKMDFSLKKSISFISVSKS